MWVDGSTAELPDSDDIREKYGVFKYRKYGKAICMGSILMMYDTLNNMTLKGRLGKIEESETSMLWKILQGDEESVKFTTILYPFQGSKTPEIKVFENSGNDPEKGVIDLRVVINGEKRIVAERLK